MKMIIIMMVIMVLMRHLLTCFIHIHKYILFSKILADFNENQTYPVKNKNYCIYLEKPLTFKKKEDSENNRGSKADKNDDTK